MGISRLAPTALAALSGRRWVAAVVIGALVGGTARADWVPVRQDRADSGGVTERGKPGSKFRIIWSDKDGNDLDPPFEGVIGPGGSTHVPNPGHGLLKRPGQTPELKKINDFRQEIEKPGRGVVGALNVLDVAAFEPVGADFYVTPYETFIADRLGEGASVRIPDLFADTNGDGGIGPGDVLHSACNLADYLPGLPSFEIGDSFTIVNGVCAELPGMIFGLDPIRRDATSPTGYSNPRPYSSPQNAVGAIAESEHEVTTIPGPGALSLVGLASGLVWKRRR